MFLPEYYLSGCHELYYLHLINPSEWLKQAFSGFILNILLRLEVLDED
jgi:hypothetical protein